MEKSIKKARPAKPTRPDLNPVNRNLGPSYFEDNQEYSSDIINSILEEVNNIRFTGNKLAIECRAIENSITELQNSVEGLTDPKLIKKVAEKIKKLEGNLRKRSKILNDYNSLNETDISYFITDKLLGYDVVDINNNVKNKMFSLRRYMDGIIKNSDNHEKKQKEEFVDLPTRKRIKEMPAIPNKSKIPVPKNPYHVDEITLFVKKFIMRQNLHKNKLLAAFELYNSNSDKTNA